MVDHSVFVRGCSLGESDVVINFDGLAIFKVLVLFEVGPEYGWADVGVERLSLIDTWEGELASSDEYLHCGDVLLLCEDDFRWNLRVHRDSSYIATHQSNTSFPTHKY